MRRKVVTRIETETGAVGTSVVCYLLRAGAALTTGGASSVPANSTATVRVRHPGALKLNDRVYWLATNGVTSGSFQINAAPTYNSGGYWEIVLLDLSGSTTAIGTTGDLVLQWAESGHWVTWYDTDTGGTGTSGVISPSATTGALSFYVDVPDLDIAVVTGGTLAGYFRDVPVERRDYVTLKEFGAVGDGSTDDSKAIQAAVDYAALNGTKIVVGDGTFIVGTGIVLKSDVTIEGNGETSVIKAVNDTPQLILITGTEISGVHIRNLRLDGNATTRGASASIVQGIYLYACWRCTVENCTFVDFGKVSATASGAVIVFVGVRETDDNDCYENRVSGCRFYDPSGYVSFALRMWSDWTENLADDSYTRWTRNNIFSDNTIVGTRWNSIEICGPATRYNTISGNIVRATFSNRGVESDKGASRNVYVGNIVESMTPDTGTTTGAFCEQGSPANSTGTHPERFSQDNVWIGNSTFNVTQSASGETVAGFYINRCKRVVIQGLHVYGYMKNGSNTNVHGIFIEEDFEDAKIAGCVINGVPSAIFLEDGDQINVTISGCELDGTYRTIRTNNSAYTKSGLIITGNTIKCDAAGEYSILITNQTNVVISGNFITGRTINLSSSFASLAAISGNVINSVTGAGIDGSSIGAGSAVITGNVITGCSGYGVRLGASGTRCVLSSNYLYNNTSGAYQDLATATEIGHNVTA